MRLIFADLEHNALADFFRGFAKSAIIENH